MTTGGVKDTVDKLIRTHKVAIFSKQGCPYCLGARNTIRKYLGKILSQSDVIFYDVDDATDARATQNYLRLITGAQTVPNVFIHGKFVGGREKLASMHRTGELETLLRFGPGAKR